MEHLPDEIWLRILRMGVKIDILFPRDLCSLAIVSRRAKRLSADAKIWMPLFKRDFFLDFKSPNQDEDIKELYKMRYQKHVARREAERNRRITRVLSMISAAEARIKRHEALLEEERRCVASAKKELAALAQRGRASVAIRIWQPTAVNTYHQKVVEQVPVDLAAEENALKCNLKERQVYISTYVNILKSCHSTIKACQEQLESLSYHPVHNMEHVEKYYSSAGEVLAKVGAHEKSTEKLATSTTFASLVKTLEREAA